MENINEYIALCDELTSQLNGSQLEKLLKLTSFLNELNNISTNLTESLENSYDEKQDVTNNTEKIMISLYATNVRSKQKELNVKMMLKLNYYIGFLDTYSNICYMKWKYVRDEIEQAYEQIMNKIKKYDGQKFPLNANEYISCKPKVLAKYKERVVLEQKNIILSQMLIQFNNDFILLYTESKQETQL